MRDGHISMERRSDMTPVHVLLRDYFIKPRKLTHQSFPGIGPEQFEALMAGDVKITPEAAASLAATLNTPVRFWIDLQDMSERWDR